MDKVDIPRRGSSPLPLRKADTPPSRTGSAARGLVIAFPFALAIWAALFLFLS